MAEPLLTTKLRPPASAAGLVARPRVAAMLTAGLRGRLTLVSAPAGFGKTTLVRQWLQEAPSAERRAPSEPDPARPPHPSVAWLSLDADDNTPPRFWSYLIAALQTVAPGVGRVAQAALLAPGPAAVEPAITALLNDLAALDAPLLLVLDDYHLITAPTTHRALDMLIEHMPEQLRLLIITREDPPLALARLRARGQLAEIRAADLRFSEAEAAEFLNAAEALDLPAADVAALAARTEGWVTGLRLAALSLRHAEDRRAFVAAFGASHRFLTDYLLDEVLGRQPPHRKAFLLQTALLDRICGPLCDAVLGLDDAAATGHADSYSQRILDELERANVFLAPLGHGRAWYRYHQLFAEFLRLRLREAEPERVPLLYRRASAWCERHGLPREALGYALAAGDEARAAALVEALAPDVLSREGPDAVIQWVAALPDALVRRRPALCVQHAWALTFVGRMAEAAGYLALAETAAEHAEPDERAHLGGQVAAHRAYLLFFRGEFAPALDAAQLALAWLPAGDATLRVRTAVVLSTLLRFAGRLAEAERTLAPLAEAVETLDSLAIATMYYSSLGEIRHERGRLREAVETFRLALDLAERRTGRAELPFTGFALVAAGQVQREWNDLDAATASVARGVALCREWRQADALAIGLIGLAQLHMDAGAFEQARRAIDELRQITRAMASPWGSATVDTWQARLDLARGDMAAAERWAQAHGLSADEPPSSERLDQLQTFAQLLVARGDQAAAERLLAAMAGQLRAAGRVDRLIPTLVWLARAQAEQGRREGALAALGEALALGEPDGYARSFLAGGPPVAELLEAHRASAAERRPYVAQLLNAFATAGHAQKAPAHTPAPHEPLNDRELAILRLMAAGLANQAIGGELFLSVNTVRWYASQIFSKLGVGGRGAAVARARELGLI